MFDLNIRSEDTIKRFEQSQKILTFDQTIDYILKHCTEWLNNPVDIIRGIHLLKNYNYYHITPVQRYARDDRNFLNLIIDNDYRWEEHQKRNHSLMFY
jgi:hypothetical protein